MKNYVLKLTEADFSPTDVSGTFRSAVIDLYDNESYKNYSTTKSTYGLDLLGNGVWTGLNQVSETETECGFMEDGKFVDTTGRIDLYGFDIDYSNRVGTSGLFTRFSVFFAEESDAEFPYEFASIYNINSEARPIEFNVDRYLVLEILIDTTENIDDLEYDVFLDVRIDGPIIAPLFGASRRMLNKFPTWTDMYKDSGYGDAITPDEFLDPLATPNYVGSSLLNSISGRWLEELEFWIKKYGIEQYIGTADINQKTHTYLTEAALVDHIVTIAGDGVEIPRVSSLYDYHQLRDDEDGVYIDPIDGGIFSNLEYDDFRINNLAHSQSYSPIWNWFDEFGLAVDLYRIPQEDNLSFKQRILDVYKNQPGVTLTRFKNALRRELDLWHEYGSTPDSDFMGATPEVLEIEDLENMTEGSTPYMGYDGIPTVRFNALAKRLNRDYPILWDHFKYNQAFWDVTGFNNEALHYLPYRYDATPVDDLDKYTPGIGAGDDLYVYKPNVPVAPIDFSADLEVRGIAKSYRVEYPELEFTYNITGSADRVEHSGPEVQTNNYLQFTIDGVVYTHNVTLASQSDIYFGQDKPSNNSLVSLTTVRPDGTFDEDAIIYDDTGALVEDPQLLNVFYDLDPSTNIVFGFGYYDADTIALVNETPVEDVRVGWMDYGEGDITAGTYIVTRDSTDDGFIMPVVINYEVSTPIKRWYSEARSYEATLNGANTNLDKLDYEHEIVDDIVWDPNLDDTPNKMWLLQMTSTDGFDGNPAASFLSYDNTTKYLPAENIEVTIDPVVGRYETVSRETDYFVATVADYLAGNEAEYEAPGALVHGLATFNLDTLAPDPVPTATISLGVGYTNSATDIQTYYVVQDGSDYVLMREAVGPDVEIFTWNSADQALIGIDNTTVKIDYLDTAGTYEINWKIYVGGVLEDTSTTTLAHSVDIDKFVVTLHTGAASASGYIVVSDSYIQKYTTSDTATWVNGIAEIPYGTETITFSSTTSVSPEYPESDDKAFIQEPFTATIENVVEGTVDENGIWRNGQPSMYQSKYNVIDALRLSRDDFGLTNTNDIFISWIGIKSNNNLVDVWLDTNTVKSEAANFSEPINYGNSYINELYNEDLDTYYLDRIIVKARLKKTVDPHWHPQVHNGYVYINGEERYMYIEPLTTSTLSSADESLTLEDTVRQGAPVIVKTDHATPIELRHVAFFDKDGATPALTLVNEETVKGSGTNILYVGYHDIYDIEVFNASDGSVVDAVVDSATNAIETTEVTRRDTDYLVSYRVRNSFYVDSSQHPSVVVFDQSPADLSATQYNVTYETNKHYPATPIDVSLNPFYTTVNEGFIFVTLSDYSVAAIELKVSPSKFIADSSMYSLVTVRSLDIYGNPKSGVTANISTNFGDIGGLDSGSLTTDADGFASFYLTYDDVVPMSGYATISFSGEIDTELQVPVAPAVEDEYILAASVKDGAIIADGGPGAVISGIVLDTSGNPAAYAVIRYRKGRTIYDTFKLAYSSTVTLEQATPSWGTAGLVIADSKGKFTIGPFIAAEHDDPGYWFVSVETQGATPLLVSSTPGTDTANSHEMVGDVVYWYEYPESIFGVEPISNQPVLPANIMAADAATPMIYQSTQVANYDFGATYSDTEVVPNWLPPKWYALDRYEQFKLGIVSTEYGIVDYSNYDEFHPDHKDF